MGSLRKSNKETGKPQQSLQQSSSTTDQFQPTVKRSHDTNTHIILIDLPGFSKDDIKVQVDTSGKLTLKGTRMTKENERQSVEQMFQVPDDVNIDQISGRLDEARLTLIMPKKETNKITKLLLDIEEEIEKKMRDSNSNKHDKNGRTDGDCYRDKKVEEEKFCWEKEDRVPDVDDENGMMETMMEGMVKTLNRNKKIIAAAVVAFTFGFYVSRKLKSNA